MRFHFPDLDRPKKAAKKISRLLSSPVALSKIHGAIAVALGYRDWHDFELTHAGLPLMPLDQALELDDFHRRSVDLTIKLATALDISDSEAQYVVLASCLTGDRAAPEDHAAIRLLCWKASGKWPSSGMAGTVVRPRISLGVTRRLAMLTADFDTRQGDLLQYISDNRCGVCVRNEIAIPRDPLPHFVPYRLRLAYGAYIEFDGATVLFSRDYAPMWRIRDGRPPQQVSPLTMIKHDHDRQQWFWEGAGDPWDNPRRIREEEDRLTSYGVAGLPALVDLLPIQVSSTGNVEMPRPILDRMRRPERLAG